MVRDDTNKYLGIVIDSKLKRNENIESLIKKHSRTYCLWKLKKFGISVDLLMMFYNAVISSTISFGAACCGGNVSKHDQGRVDKVIHRAGRIVGRQLDNFLSLYQGELLHKASQILQDHSHPLHVKFYSWLSHRSSRFLLPNTKTNRYTYFVLPSAISVLNTKLDRYL